MRGNQRGFTVVELLVTMAIMVILVAISVPRFWNFLNKYQADAYTADLVQVLRLAQNKAMMSEGDSPYSVHLIPGAGGSFTLYRGTNYALRDATYDEPHVLPGVLSLSYTVPDADVSFSKIEGATTDIGTITISWNEGGISHVVDINEVGRIDPP